MKFEYAAPSALGVDETTLVTPRLLNVYRQRLGDKTVVRSVLGTEVFANLPTLFVRAAETIQGKLYVVQGGIFYRVSESGTVTSLGAVPDSPETTISGNNGNIAIVANGRYFVWDGSDITEPATGAFSAFSDVTFVNQFTVATERGGRRVQWSALADAGSLPALNFATTESRDDNVLRSMAIAGGVMFFKERSIESWYVSGSDLKARPGSTIELGLKAFGLIAKIPNGAVFIGSDDRVYMTFGGVPEPISTDGVEISVAAELPTNVFYYEDAGHKFCVLRYADRPAWVFDITTGEWHERAEGNDLGPWTARACVKAYRQFFAINDTGGVLRMTRNNADASGELIRRIVGRTYEMDGQRFKLHRLEIPANVGAHDAEPTMTLRVSGDRGHTWRLNRQYPMGVKGQYDRRIILRNLGQYQKATFEITVSDPQDVALDAVIYG